MPTEQREGVTRIEIDGSTGNRRSLQFRWKAAAFGGGTSRMRRESHVRSCEGLGVRFPGPTRLVLQRRNERRLQTVVKLRER